MEAGTELTREEIEILMNAVIPLVRQSFKAYDKYKDINPRLPSPPQNLREAENDLRLWGVPLLSLQCLRQQEQVLTAMKETQIEIERDGKRQEQILTAMETTQTEMKQDGKQLVFANWVLIAFTIVLCILTVVLICRG